ncbi:hypothetical protein AHP1_351 [Aeromonas phage Ahp1_CNU-2021]|nr:hypothetical protein AHP1_351 [Aeromonas phage Ahp1_CNU-2021]
MSVEIEKAIEIMKPFEGRHYGGLEIYYASCKAFDVLFDNPWKRSIDDVQREIIKYKARPYRCTPMPARNRQYRNVVAVTLPDMSYVIEKLYGKVVLNGKTIKQWLSIFRQTGPLNHLARNLFQYSGRHSIGVNAQRCTQALHDFMHASCLAMFQDGRGFPVSASHNTIYWVADHVIDIDTVDFHDLVVGFDNFVTSRGALVVGFDMCQTAFGQMETVTMFGFGPKITIESWMHSIQFEQPQIKVQ